MISGNLFQRLLIVVDLVKLAWRSGGFDCLPDNFCQGERSLAGNSGVTLDGKE